MSLTPTEQLHYDAIDKNIIPVSYNDDDITRMAQACAKITEQEKLKFAIEKLQSLYEYAHPTSVIGGWIKELQQQLNELTV